MIYILLFVGALIFSLAIGKPLIYLLKSLNIKQTIREDGPKEHIKKKSLIPTIGGLIFLIPVFTLTLTICFLKRDFQSEDLVTVLLVTLAMSLLGFTDDYLKILKKHNKGISGWMKLFVQLSVSLIIYYKYKDGNGIIYLAVVFFIIAGASNSYNLTDGLDGLLGSISILSFLGFIALFFANNNMNLLCFSVIFLGSLLGFLYFNKHPAKVFMGDTGSLAIGGAIGTLAIVSHSELYLASFATIPILEALSVILQVTTFQYHKRFHGKDKRIFKMAPLHHHFELVGWKETSIVKRFFMFQLVCILIGVMFIYFKN